MKSLFINEIVPVPEIKLTQAELDRLISQFPKFDVYYVASAALQERRDFLEDLWKSYEPYAEKNFIKEAQTHFHQRSWEMYIGNVFLKNGHNLERASANAPDIKIISQSTPTVWIECIAIERGETADRVPQMQYGIVQHIPQEQILLRIASGVEEKSKKILKYIANGSVKEKEPRVIAINRARLSHVDGDLPYVVKVLFAMGHPTLLFNKGHSEVIDSFYSQRDKITKQSGSDVGMGHFLSDKYKHISAVIYSMDYVINRKEPIGRECVLVLNPFADAPLPADTFPFMTKYIGEENKVHIITPQEIMV